jgi:XTP/dITP diphosphohydrolase
MMLPPVITIATSNTHKVEEFQQLLQPLGIEVVGLHDSSLMQSIDETGQTFEENAYIKARIVADRTGLAVLADDSGLEVDALHGHPGVRSARYAGPNATDADNRDFLARELAAIGVTSSTGRFRCALAWIDPQRTVIVDGVVDGILSCHKRGEHGFGYDSMFTPEGEDRTFAEMSAERKHAISHRGRAVTVLLSSLMGQTSTRHYDDPDWLLYCAGAAVHPAPKKLQNTLRAIRTNAQASEAYEVFLQSYLFGGFPVALDALQELAAYCSANNLYIAHGLDHDNYDVDLFSERGTALCRTVYGSVFDRMMERLSSVSPELSQWMIVEGYGKTLSRDGLSLIDRELCIVIQLAMFGRRNQLFSHIRGAYNAGAAEYDIERCVAVLMDQGMTKAANLLIDVHSKVRS